MLLQIQRRQIKSAIFVSQIGRLLDADRPRCDELPEWSLAVALQCPFARLAAVVLEEHGEHCRPPHHVEQFGVSP